MEKGRVKVLVTYTASANMAMALIHYLDPHIQTSNPCVFVFLIIFVIFLFVSFFVNSIMATLSTGQAKQNMAVKRRKKRMEKHRRKENE